MNRNKKCIVRLIALLFYSHFLYASNPRIEYSVNTDWAFFRGDIENGQSLSLNDSDWIPAIVPHIMQLEKKHCGGDMIYDGVGWYRRYFKLPEKYENKRIALSFEGVMNCCDVFINGNKVTTHHGGYVGFTVDISRFVKFHGENNLLAVRVSAEYDSLTPPGKPQDRLDFYYYSGIYRDVKMVVTDKLHISDELEVDEVAGEGIFVTYPEVDKTKARVHVRTHIRNLDEKERTGKLMLHLKNPNGKVIAMDEKEFMIDTRSSAYVEQDLQVRNPNLWHPYHPDLYTLECKVVEQEKVIDIRREEIGIRTIRYTTEKGFFINGEPLYLIGANRHQAFPNVGDAASNSMQERDVIDMKRGGYNAVRAAHYPQDPAFLSACDKYGLLVVECIPGWQYYNEDPIFADRLEQVGRQMIRRDRNHASVVLWETALNETQYPLSVVKRIYDAAHEEYPGDQFYTSGDYFSHEETEPYYDVFYKQVGRFPKDGNVMSNYLEDQISIKPLFTREWGDGVGEKPRVELQENEYELMRQCRSRYKQLNGNGYFDWCMLDANPRMGGHFMWSYNDYARGAEEYTMYSGAVDVNRYPKFSYYMMQSMRSKDISQKGLYDGPMVHIASYNSSAEYPSASTEIMVFSNCDSVRLYQNNRLVDIQSRNKAAQNYPWIVEKGGSPCFIFNAGKYEAGTLKAEGIINGKVIKEHIVRTPDIPDHVEVVIPDHPVVPMANGSDMIPVYFKVCDKNGTVVNTSSAEIQIEVSGEGNLIGDKINRIGINPQRVEAGIGFAFIRTTKKAGKIFIKASSKGLKDDYKTCVSRRSEELILPDGDHSPFSGNEEDGVVVKDTKWDKEILSRPVLKIEKIEGSSGVIEYPLLHVIDEDDFSWWISQEDSFPQVITLSLPEVQDVYASRIRFQKDSSLYKHKVEISDDGKNWEPLYERECTGWDFKPIRIEKKFKYFRLIIENVSEGRAGLAEITLFK